jgi:hypothetical protein
MSSDDAVLEDGEYDAFVVWAEAGDAGRVTLDLAITTGVRRGETLTVTGPARLGSSRAPIDLVGLPCTLLVENGKPRVEF